MLLCSRAWLQISHNTTWLSQLEVTLTFFQPWSQKIRDGPLWETLNQLVNAWGSLLRLQSTKAKLVTAATEQLSGNVELWTTPLFHNSCCEVSFLRFSLFYVSLSKCSKEMLLAELSVGSCRVVILPLNRTFQIRWDFRQDSVYLSGGNCWGGIFYCKKKQEYCNMTANSWRAWELWSKKNNGSSSFLHWGWRSCAEGAAAQADQRPPANHLLSAVQRAAQAFQLESI